MTLDELRRRQHQSVGYLLIRAGQLWNERAIAGVNALAGAPVLRESHTVLAYLLFFTFLAHLGAALFHGLIRRDGVLESMASVSSKN